MNKAKCETSHFYLLFIIYTDDVFVTAKKQVDFYSFFEIPTTSNKVNRRKI